MTAFAGPCLCPTHTPPPAHEAHRDPAETQGLFFKRQQKPVHHRTFASVTGQQERQREKTTLGKEKIYPLGNCYSPARVKKAGETFLKGQRLPCEWSRLHPFMAGMLWRGREMGGKEGRRQGKMGKRLCYLRTGCVLNSETALISPMPLPLTADSRMA